MYSPQNQYSHTVVVKMLHEIKKALDNSYDSYEASQVVEQLLLDIAPTYFEINGANAVAWWVSNRQYMLDNKFVLLMQKENSKEEIRIVRIEPKPFAKSGVTISILTDALGRQHFVSASHTLRLRFIEEE